MIIDNLSEAEKRIIELSLDGLSTKEMARVLNNSPRTIDAHRLHIFNKVNAKNITHVIGMMYRELNERPTNI